jgi:hypothetical protein
MVFGIDGVDAPAVAVAYRVGELVDVGGVEDSDVRSLRRLMIRSPTPMRCPRAAVTVGASASAVSVVQTPVERVGHLGGVTHQRGVGG